MPACDCRAPQQGAASLVGRTPKPAASITRWVAWWTSRCQASMTQPVNIHTSSPDATRGSWRIGSLSGKPKRSGNSPVLLITASAAEPARSNFGDANGLSAACCHFGVSLPISTRVSRVCSIKWPYGTALGHAGSQPRHCTQVANASTTSSVTGASLSCT